MIRLVPAFLLVLALCLGGPPAAGAQTVPPSTALRVFLDCGRCDFDYLRREIPFVNWVRDRKDAELHILATTQGTGSGGTEYVFQFIGLQRFDGVNDELKFTALQTDTDDERRQGYTRVLKLGLVRYVTSTDLSDYLHLQYRAPEQPPAVATPSRDPWNFWVFRIRGNSSMNGEQRSSAHSFSTSLSANRTTEAWKIGAGANLNLRENEYTLSSGEKLVDKTHDNNASATIVMSLGDHWSAATRARIASSTYVNQDRALRLGGGIEYSFFPYRESSRRELTAQLSLGYNHLDYDQTTIYGKDRESIADASLNVAFDVRQPWGSSGVSLETAAYLSDPSKHRVAFDAEMDVRLFKGFSVNTSGSVSRIRDQIYLPAGDATDEEILLRRRQLATSYRYRFSVGLSYTFGSIFNNVVNPRF